MNKPIGQIIGDLIAVLLNKDVLTLEEVKVVVGEDNYNKMIEEDPDNDDK